MIQVQQRPLLFLAILLPHVGCIAQVQNDEEKHINIHHHYESEHHFELFVNYYEGLAEVIELDYEYVPGIWERRLGIALSIGRKSGDEKEWSFAIPIYLHPYKGAKLFAGPTLYLRERPENVQDSTQHEQVYFTRFGFGYDLHYKKITLTPTFNFDISNEETISNLGMSVGYLF